MYETGYSGEVSDPELLKGLALVALPIAAGLAAKHEAAKTGLARPLPAMLGIGTAAATFLTGRHFAGSPQSPSSVQYPPNRHLEL